MRRRNYIQDVLSAAMLPLVALVVIPVALYGANQREYEYNACLLVPYGVLLVGALLVIAAGLACTGVHARGRAAAVLFMLGVYVALSDILAPVQLGQLKRTILMEPIAEPWTRDLLDAMLLVAAIVLGARLSVSAVRRFGPIVVVVLALSEGVALYGALREGRAATGFENTRRSPPEQVSSAGNVYHVVFDGFSGLTFPDELELAGGREDFTGFIWYEQHRSNYLETYVSVPSFMTGSLYQGGSLATWIARGRTAGILEDARNAGYAVWQYVPSRSYVHHAAGKVVMQNSLQRSDRADACHFADLVIVRIAPHGLHQEVYPVGSRGLASRLFGGRMAASAPEAAPLRAVALMRRLIADEPGRPATGQYVYAHIGIPHVPYVLNTRGEFAPGGGYGPQAGAAIMLMREFIAELKRLDRYADALIIFHSDHGDGDIGPATLDGHELAPGALQRITALESRWGFMAVNTLNVSRALLLVKAPGAQGQLRTDATRATQNADLAATICQVRGISGTFEVGQSVLDASFPAQRDVHYYQGFSVPNQFGMNVRFGVRAFKGKVEHLVYRPGVGNDFVDYLDVTW